MTYNWNTMVEITVPTGTNGWLYSGEVIINGVKVRFPVGTPTSVPEPAAVLLKKMIELEQEEDANTAKPQNHYVGDVTIPAGKTLTLEEGAMVNDMAGGLGGGSASAGGGGGVVKILHASTDFDPNTQTFSNSQAVETYADMRSVYDNDGLLWCRLKMNFVVDGAVQFSTSVECPCAGCDDEVISFTPLGTMASMGILASLKNDDTFTVEID